MSLFGKVLTKRTARSSRGGAVETRCEISPVAFNLLHGVHYNEHGDSVRAQSLGNIPKSLFELIHLVHQPIST